MPKTVARRTIDAPASVVFDAVAHIERFREAVPDIVGVEFLSEQRTGVGTRFRETRVMHGKKASTELEVTEYEPGRRVRLVSDTAGTVWDTVFTVDEADGGTELEMVMDARPYKLLPKLVNPLIRGVVAKAIQRDMDALKTYCERVPT